MLQLSKYKIAVIIPCLNEEATISNVVEQFSEVLQTECIYVVDNVSTDNTVSEAINAGAMVLSQSIPGKAHAIRHAFANVDAEIYIMVDGDATYDPKAAPIMVEKLISEQLDMVVAKRSNSTDGAYRFGHQFGNHFFNKFFKLLFGGNLNDIFFGYRVFSKRFVKSFPI